MKLLLWVLPAVMLLLLILCVTGVAPISLAYTVIPGLVVIDVIAANMTARKTTRR